METAGIHKKKLATVCLPSARSLLFRGFNRGCCRSTRSVAFINNRCMMRQEERDLSQFQPPRS